MAPHLKVFRTHLGFYDAVVAAPSRKAALAAWGSKQDMFRAGFASETNEADIRKAALAKPGIVLRRAAGSKDAFSENPSLPRLPPSVKAKAKVLPRVPVERKRTSTPKRLTTLPSASAPPDRTKFDAAMKALAKLDTEAKNALAEIARRRSALDDDEKRVKREFERRRRKAKDVLEHEKRALTRAR